MVPKKCVNIILFRLDSPLATEFSLRVRIRSFCFWEWNHLTINCYIWWSCDWKQCIPVRFELVKAVFQTIICDAVPLDQRTPTFQKTVMSSPSRIKKPKKRSIVVWVEVMYFWQSFFVTNSRQNLNGLNVRIKSGTIGNRFSYWEILLSTLSCKRICYSWCSALTIYCYTVNRQYRQKSADIFNQ